MTARVLAVSLLLALAATTPAAASPTIVAPTGRALDPVGRQTVVGDFPTGGALTPDGRFFWSVSAGHGHDDVVVVAVASGQVTQRLPLPGAYGGIAFSPDGRRAYVSGEPKGCCPASGPTKGDQGDVVHVFSVSAGGQATELAPIAMPATSGGTAQQHAADPTGGLFPVPGPGPSSAGLGWPEGLAVTPNGKTLLVVLAQADQLAIVDLANGSAQLVKTGTYPNSVAASPDGRTAYVTTEGDGTLDVVDIASATRTTSIGVGGTDGNADSHPEGVVLDPHRSLAYVAVASRDLVAVVDTATSSLVRTVSLARDPAPGVQPVALAVDPAGRTLWVADAGDDTVAAIALDARDGADPFDVVGRVPVAEYPSAVAITPDGSKLVWQAAEGFGAGPNPGYGIPFAHSEAAPYGTYVPDMLLGRIGVMHVPNDDEVRAMNAAALHQATPVDSGPAPAGTVLRAGGPIKHVFYVVKENRTYDQIFGSDPHGDGDPSLEVFDDNGVSGPAGGVTPNVHAISRRFGLFDHVFSDSQVSVDGHIITTSAYAIDYVERALHANYSDRGKADEFGSYPITLPPRHSLFDAAAANGVSFQVFGESSQGSGAAANDGRSTYPLVAANTILAYPPVFGCAVAAGSPGSQVLCDRDSGTIGVTNGAQDIAHSRFDAYQAYFNAEVTTGTVPALTYLTLPNDHTNGVHAGYPTPSALVADNDLGLGQLVDMISHSPIWSSSAIFVVEDDSQDGADHVDAHRQVASVISPWTKGGTISTHYDQASFIRSMELILGLEPLSLLDGLATPLYDAFRTDGHPDDAPYDAIPPKASLDATTSAAAAKGLDAALPANVLDGAPQELYDEAIYRSVYGRSFHAPPPGPNAAPDVRAQARAVRRAYRLGGLAAVHRLLAGAGLDDE